MCRIIAVLHLGQQRSWGIFNSKLLSLKSIFLLFVSVKRGHFFLGLLGAPPRRHVSPAWQCFNFAVVQTPLLLPLQGFNPNVLPTVFESQHSHFDVGAQGEFCDNNMDYSDTFGVLLRPLRSSRGWGTDSRTSEWGSVIITPIQVLDFSVQFYLLQHRNFIYVKNTECFELQPI